MLISPSHNVALRTFPAVAPALFLAFWAPLAPVQAREAAPPLALGHVFGSIALLLLYAVPSYVVAHDEVCGRDGRGQGHGQYMA